MLSRRDRKLLEAQPIEVLRPLMVQAAEHIEKLETELKQLREAKAAKDQAAFIMEEKVKLLRRSLFADSSESRAEAGDRPRERSEEEAMLFAQAAFPAPEESGAQKGKSKGKDLASQTIVHEMSEAELQLEAKSRGLNGSWIDTGLFDQSTKIQVIERSYIKEVHQKRKYKFKPAQPEDLEKELIVTATGPSELLPGMNYTTEFVAGVVADKYISHVPLERQLREMESLGLKGMRNSTLSKLSALAAASLEPVAESVLKEDLLPSELALHLDETPWKVQNKHEQDGYMWVISNHRGSYYFFEPSRSAKVIVEKLLPFYGPLLSDGFSSYDTHIDLSKNPHAYCWAHARREFLPLEGHDPTVKPILDLIDDLFEIEREAKNFEELAQLRRTKSQPTLEHLKTGLYDELPKSREQSQKRKAIEYCLKRWSGLSLFVSDTRIPLSNNEAERTIRHAVMGRKNYYGSGSHTGAQTAATLFTVIESCKKNEIDPRTFILMSLNRVACGQSLETPLAYAKRIRSRQHGD
jgi:transposase